MNPAELNAWMTEHFTRSAFRLETLQTYEVASDGSDFRRYLDGERTWTPERKQPWLDHLKAEREQGLYRHRVRIVTRPITPYTRYECEWGYAPNVAAGEDVRVIDLGEHELPTGAPDVEHWLFDWWLVEDSTGGQHVVGMDYEDDGQFRGGRLIDADARVDDLTMLQFATIRDQLWAAAEPFTSWWGRHGDLRRDGARAA